MDSEPPDTFIRLLWRAIKREYKTKININKTIDHFLIFNNPSSFWPKNLYTEKSIAKITINCMANTRARNGIPNTKSPLKEFATRTIKSIRIKHFVKINFFIIK